MAFTFKYRYNCCNKSFIAFGKVKKQKLQKKIKEIFIKLQHRECVFTNAVFFLCLLCVNMILCL